MANVNAASAAVEKLWGRASSPEDAVKLAVARELISLMKTSVGKQVVSLTLGQAGQTVAAALGEPWGKLRGSQGKGSLKDLLLADPCFTVTGNPSIGEAKLQLDVRKLSAAAAAVEEAAGDHPGVPGAKTIDPSFWEDLPHRAGAPPCGLHAKLGWCIHRADCPFDHPPGAPKAAELRASMAARERSGAVRLLRSAGGGAAVAVRPGERDCGPYLVSGFCNYGSRCRYNHPPLIAEGHEAEAAAATAASGDVALNAAGLPLRPGMKICTQWAKKGYCKQGTHCPLHHPADASAAAATAARATAAAAGPSGSGGASTAGAAGASGASGSKSAAAVSGSGSRPPSRSGTVGGASLSAAAAGADGEGSGDEEEERGGGVGGGGAAGRGAGGVGGEEEDAVLIAVAEAEQTPPRSAWRWPDGRSAPRGWGWAEAAVRVILPPRGAGRSLRYELLVAELNQHLAMVEVIAVACACYAKHPHLLQVFAPYARAGPLEMPATVYLIDTINPHAAGEAVAALKTALESVGVLKVCHSTMQWAGHLAREFGVQVTNYFDTQQAHHVLTSMRGALGRAAPHFVAGSADVSLAALLRQHHMWHPVRHDTGTEGAKRVWQQRPMTDDLITCAAADVAYLIPLAECLVPQMVTTAQELIGLLGARAGTAEVPVGLVEEMARGAVRGDGSVSLVRMALWAGCPALQQGHRFITAAI